MMGAATIVQVSRPGCAAVKGVIAGVAGYRIRVSVLNRKDRGLTQDAGLEAGVEVELVFHSGDRAPTPAISALLNAVTVERASTVLDIEVTDWRKLADYWQTASLKHDRSPSGDCDEASPS